MIETREMVRRHLQRFVMKNMFGHELDFIDHHGIFPWQLHQSGQNLAGLLGLYWRPARFGFGQPNYYMRSEFGMIKVQFMPMSGYNAVEAWRGVMAITCGSCRIIRFHGDVMRAGKSSYIQDFLDMHKFDGMIYGNHRAASTRERKFPYPPDGVTNEVAVPDGFAAGVLGRWAGFSLMRRYMK